MATRTTTLNMKTKNIVEISDDMKTALFLVRKENGQVDFAIAKGEPHLFEMMTMTFGIFVSMVKSLDNLENAGELVRNLVKESSLEEARQAMGRMTDLFYELSKEGQDHE